MFCDDDDFIDIEQLLEAKETGVIGTLGFITRKGSKFLDMVKRKEIELINNELKRL